MSIFKCMIINVYIQTIIKNEIYVGTEDVRFNDFESSVTELSYHVLRDQSKFKSSHRDLVSIQVHGYIFNKFYRFQMHTRNKSPNSLEN
jgi:hypothetical protein